MSDDATLLIRLVEAAEQQLARGHALGHDSDELGRLLGEARRRPCDGERFVDDEAVMIVTALKNVQFHQADGDADRKVKWEMIVGALLPMVRDASRRAIEARRRHSVPLT